MVEKGCIWQDWDVIVVVSLFTSVNTRLHLLSKKLWAMIHKTFTHVNELLYRFSEADNFLFQFFHKSGGIWTVFAMAWKLLVPGPFSVFK